MSRPRKAQEQVSNAQVRKTLEDDVQAYLAKGKKIEQVPTGFSNQDPLGGRRHIILGPSRKS
ncbi:MAG: hypothetical protein RIC56_16865 [Pseudomonadales bacterium]